MKKLFKFIAIVIILMLIFFATAAILVPRFGKDIAVQQIEKALGRKTALQRIDFRIPLGVTIKGLEIEGLCKINEISVSPGILGLFSGKVILNDLRLIAPDIYLERSAEGKFNFLPKQAAPAVQPGSEASASAPALKKGKRDLPEFIVTNLMVKDGKVDFNDKNTSSQDLEIIFKDINISVSKIKFPPTALRADFKAAGNLVSPDNNWLGSVETAGWIDWDKKDMDAKLNVKNLEAAYFHPYIGDFLSHRKVLSAKLDLAAVFQAKNNDLAIVCDFNLHNLIYAQQDNVESEILDNFNLMRDALDLFTDANGNLRLEFTIHTELDRPQLSGKKLKKIILEAAGRNLLNQDPQDVAVKIQKAIKDFGDFGKKVSDIFQGK